MEDRCGLPGKQRFECQDGCQSVGKNPAALLVSRKGFGELLKLEKLHESRMLGGKVEDFRDLDPRIVFVELVGSAKVRLLFGDLDFVFQVGADIGKEISQVEPLDLVDVGEIRYQCDQPV